MTIISKSLIFTVLCALLIIFISCAPQAPETAINVIENEPVPEDNTVTLVITRDFGKEIIFEDEIKIESNSNAMTILQDAVEVETKYGGGFVHAINGISSQFEGSNGQKKDWFFIMNGLSCSMGAADYTVNPGDIEHWDFRDWGHYQLVPAIIGDFPQPFLNGYRGIVYPTTIIYEQEFLNEADSLVETLKKAGVDNVTALDINQLTDQVQSRNNIILISRTGNNLIEELSKAQKKLGLYVYVENGGFILIDAAGKKSQALNMDCSVIQATQNPWNPKGSAAGENILWTITGTSDKAVKNAVAVLNTRFADIKYAFAVAVTDTDIIKIP
jgi:hypothetical protein